MYTRDEAKRITDMVIDMAKGADGVEVTLTGGERSGTRWANSTITTNLVQYDRQVNVTVRKGQKVGTSDTRDFSEQGLRAMVTDALAEAEKANDSPGCSASGRSSARRW
jgi:predicted Zn-dependent protease